MNESELENHFREGCWVRVIEKEEEEIEILRKRDGQTRQNLLRHSNQKTGSYTKYSSCTFIKEGLPIDLFYEDYNIGVFIRHIEDSIHWFHYGHDFYTIQLDFSLPVRCDRHGCNNELFSDATKKDICKSLDRRYEWLLDDIYLEDHPDYEVSLGWNEGLFRYQKSDIIGILVQPKSNNSLNYALAFQEQLGIDLPCYSYDVKGKIQREMLQD